MHDIFFGGSNATFIRLQKPLCERFPEIPHSAVRCIWYLTRHQMATTVWRNGKPWNWRNPRRSGGRWSQFRILNERTNDRRRFLADCCMRRASQLLLSLPRRLNFERGNRFPRFLFVQVGLSTSRQALVLFGGSPSQQVGYAVVKGNKWGIW